MSDLRTFRDMMYRNSPPWLQGTLGAKLLYSIALHLDALGDTITAAIKARFPALYTTETLGMIGRDRGVRRGFDESDGGYGGRLDTWLVTRKHKGNPFWLMREVQGFLGTHAMRMRVVNNAGAWYTKEADGTESYLAPAFNFNWDNDGFLGPHWSRFWLIIYPNGFWTKGGQWGAGANWGGFTFNNNSWGSTATREQVQGIQAIVDDWKGAHSRCVNIIVAFDNSMFDPTAGSLPDGNWGNYAKIVGGLYVASRDRRALYWAGSLSPQ